MNELALFAGAGGGILGGKLLGWRTVCAVERDAHPAQVLAQRQNDGILEAFPIWSDVCSFDGRPWRGIVDVISGGFPCQDISVAGKGAGIEGERSGMWKEMARIIGDVQPRYVFVENSPMLTTRGLGTVLADLATLGFDAEWGVLSAADVGANHKRERIWILGPSHHNGQIAAEIRKIPVARSHSDASKSKQTCQFKRSSKQHAQVADTEKLHSNERLDHGENRTSEVSKLRDGRRKIIMADTSSIGTQVSPQREVSAEQVTGSDSCKRRQESLWWSTEPNVGRVANGLAFRVDRLKAIGNGQVPRVAATAFEQLKKRLADQA